MNFAATMFTNEANKPAIPLLNGPNNFTSYTFNLRALAMAHGPIMTGVLSGALALPVAVASTIVGGNVTNQAAINARAVEILAYETARNNLHLPHHSWFWAKSQSSGGWCPYRRSQTSLVDPLRLLPGQFHPRYRRQRQQAYQSQDNQTGWIPVDSQHRCFRCPQSRSWSRSASVYDPGAHPDRSLADKSSSPLSALHSNSVVAISFWPSTPDTKETRLTGQELGLQRHWLLGKSPLRSQSWWATARDRTSSI